jgi:oligopeptide/dipeptide ABC transporter ATP-binding protein
VADPKARKETIPIEGEVPSPFNLPAGCVFETRCPYAKDVCQDTKPFLTELAEGEYVACHFPLSS